MIGVSQPITRAIVVIALLAAATIALQGYLPGAPADSSRAPSPLLVAVMPVLLLVSIVILVAGVIASQHRLPLAMPQAEREATPRFRWRRLALLGPIVVAVIALVFAGGVTALFLLPGAKPMRPASETLPEGSGPVPTPVDAPAPDPGTGPAELTGTALLIGAALAVVLIVIALLGLVVVAVAARREPAPVAPAAPEPEPSDVDSLTRAAEMGLAAMNAPGQDPRTAIIACYVAMERGLSSDNAARPLASDTPMEVLARAFESGVLHDASARELVALFEEARFSPHSMLEWQRMRAEQLLRIVLSDLQRRLVAA
ncbi:DUF4129 domain-containing protein [Nocardia asteroides NBRC 15531]|uniref:Protein-glutamine gamma-glutamyltransferase-like C-terminal domain-containing protein n=1 Tax=Nocardia asteroides NBRC 15531 TaxID=1110697 RepID=U5EDX0_NOCAS|nr:DUF4129 domain-containing protein [Nocardia asteroides NBRC 15531]GAD84596.1 hypothetical protein NCAST_25_00160 [Nocardia asteroides NBRC 15531]SFN69189.1 protein of unknown function [Nocardia asteroides]VEG32938.1 Uncharacterised protein [Nocardia asteroides]